MIGKKFIVIYDWETFPPAVHEFDTLDEAQRDRQNYPDPESYPIYTKLEFLATVLKTPLQTLSKAIQPPVPVFDGELTQRLPYFSWNNDGVEKFVSGEISKDYTTEEE